MVKLVQPPITELTTETVGVRLCSANVEVTYGSRAACAPVGNRSVLDIVVVML